MSVPMMHTTCTKNSTLELGVRKNQYIWYNNATVDLSVERDARDASRPPLRDLAHA